MLLYFILFLILISLLLIIFLLDSRLRDYFPPYFAFPSTAVYWLFSHLYFFSSSKILHLVSLTWLVVTKLALLYVCFKFKMFPPINKFTNFTGNRFFLSIDQSINQSVVPDRLALRSVCVCVCMIGVFSRLHDIIVAFHFGSAQTKEGCVDVYFCVYVCVCFIFV